MDNHIFISGDKLTSNQYILWVKAQGFDAAIEGLQYADNPYPTGSPEWEWWETGMTNALWQD